MQPMTFSCESAILTLALFGDGEYMLHSVRLRTGAREQYSFVDFNAARRAFFKACEAACPAIPLHALAASDDPHANPDRDA